MFPGRKKTFHQTDFTSTYTYESKVRGDADSLGHEGQAQQGSLHTTTRKYLKPPGHSGNGPRGSDCPRRQGANPPSYVIK